jgi:hypothetical protein
LVGVKSVTVRSVLLSLLLLFGLNLNAQVNWCDSISYSVLPNTNSVFSVMIETTDSLDNYCDTVDVAWAVCNLQLCFNGFGAFYSFPIIQTTDTVKVCYNAYIMNPPSPTISCYDVCEWIVHNGTEWVEWNNTVGVEELQMPEKNKHILHDMQGRVVTDIKKNTMYILDKKKFIIFQRNK